MLTTGQTHLMPLLANCPGFLGEVDSLVTPGARLPAPELARAIHPVQYRGCLGLLVARHVPKEHNLTTLMVTGI